MTLILMVAGAVLGAWLADRSDTMLGMGLGIAIGYLLSQVRDLKSSLRRLEGAAAEPRPAGPSAAPEPRPPPSPPKPHPQPAVVRRAMEPPARRDEPAPAAPEASPAAGGKDLFERLFALAKRWLTTGNVPVKLGVVVSFFGVAFLLRYAVDHRLLVLPIEVRLLGVTAFAVVLLGVGWRLRARQAVYALSLQGGGIGILYLTIFAAYRLYGLLPAPLAFGLLVVLTAAAGLLAVLQNARALAILGSVGGFLAPVLVSTGQGSHVALFSYYLLLNAAILGISWYRAWRLLNLLGFAFTFGIGTLWGYRYYQPEFYASTQPFLIIYFLFYQAIAILFAFRQPPNLRGLVDGTILFGTPVIAFALQAELVETTEYGLAISAAAVAVFYTLLATWLFRRHREKMRLMVESYTALGVAFATLAIPLALDDRWTAAAWALEGAALIWVGVRQGGRLAKASGVALLFASGLAFFEGGWRSTAETLPVLNGNLLAGWLIALSSLFGAYRLHRDADDNLWQTLASVALLGWGLAWWFGTGYAETFDHAAGDYVGHTLVLFTSASGALLAWFARRSDWRAAARSTLALLPVLALLGLLYVWDSDHLLHGFGWVVWPLAVAAHFYALRQYALGERGVERYWHIGGALLLVVGVAVEAYYRVDTAGLSDTWASSAVFLVLPLAAWLVHWLTPRLDWPLGAYADDYRIASGTLIVAQLVLLVGASFDQPGDPAPLPYLLLLNPLDAVTVVGLVTALRFLLLDERALDESTVPRFRDVLIAWCVVAFVLTTAAVVRGVHHVADVPWGGGALYRSTAVQGALSIYWAMLAFGGMIAGARRASRVVWIAGTVLMALVVGKLFLVDLGNTGTVARIVSFLGVGGLLLVVGYFAPAPPRRLPGEST